MIYDLQKASMWKRISAFLFDAILLGIVVVLFGWLLSNALGYDRYNDALNKSYEKYAEEFQVNFNMSLSDYENMTPEEAQRLDSAYAALSADSTAVHAYDMMIQLTLLIISIGLLLAFLLMEFAVPLLFGNGQTLGKKVFGLGLMRSDGVKISAVSLFIRTVLGKYTIETMIPVLILIMIYWGSIGIVGPVVLLLILVIQAAVLIATRTNALIHDLLAGTVAVDIASQMIFDTMDDMIAYKQKVHAEAAARQAY